MNQVILASASPRRKELLSHMGIPFIVIPSQCQEVITTNVPEKLVQELAFQKADDVADTRKEGIVIGSDTIVLCDGEILGKPKDEQDAYRMLSLLQGKSHVVYTGISLIKKELGSRKVHTFFESAEVFIYPMTPDEIWAYIKSEDPMDKAGAYGIQGIFGMFIKKVCGEYNTIVGLPIARLYQEWKKLGFDSYVTK